MLLISWYMLLFTYTHISMETDAITQKANLDEGIFLSREMVSTIYQYL